VLGVTRVLIFASALAAVQRRQYPDDVLKVELIKEFMDKVHTTTRLTITLVW
jgi:hypothetical protein